MRATGVWINLSGKYILRTRHSCSPFLLNTIHSDVSHIDMLELRDARTPVATQEYWHHRIALGERTLAKDNIDESMPCREIAESGVEAYRPGGGSLRQVPIRSTTNLFVVWVAYTSVNCPVVPACALLCRTDWAEAWRSRMSLPYGWPVQPTELPWVRVNGLTYSRLSLPCPQEGGLIQVIGVECPNHRHMTNMRVISVLLILHQPTIIIAG